MSEKFIRIVNWERFQHYKHRNPPWIKLYCEMLSSRTWVALDDSSRVLAFAILMLAGRNDNKIPLDPAYIRRVAYLNREPDFSGLLETNFVEIVDASNTLATCTQHASNLHQNATPETEKSRDREEAEAEGELLAQQTIPPGLTQIEYARALLEDLGLPLTGNIHVVADSISADAKKHGVTKAESFEFIRQKALADQTNGTDRVDRFYFTDAKFRRVPPMSRSDRETAEFLRRHAND